MVDVQTGIVINRPRAEVAEYAANVPGERLVMRTVQGPFPMQTTYTWADDDGGTRMTPGNSGRPRVSRGRPRG